MALTMAPLTVAQLVDQHHAELYRYAFRLSGSVADAEDLTQQVFLVAQQKLAQIREAGCARSWLFAVLRNDYLKGFRRHVPLLAASLDMDLSSVPDENGDPTDDNLTIDPERLQTTLNELPDDFKIVLMLYYFEDRTYQEIADELSIPLGTVMSRLSRAKQHLRRRLFERENKNGEHNSGSVRLDPTTLDSIKPQRPIVTRR